eukprot:TRINITY_DN105057_c0_g1_i1.p1 TRINITY_DN105057_c0_g1~~TRINITY_DN105057_c0_g1_i1.p1  ORF type:complete len:186 (+),score=29.62 TRINITY_DN105057_c0_g1_i1:346-903(+)
MVQKAVREAPSDVAAHTLRAASHAAASAGIIDETENSADLRLNKRRNISEHLTSSAQRAWAKACISVETHASHNYHTDSSGGLQASQPSQSHPWWRDQMKKRAWLATSIPHVSAQYAGLSSVDSATGAQLAAASSNRSETRHVADLDEDSRFRIAANRNDYQGDAEPLCCDQAEELPIESVFLSL